VLCLATTFSSRVIERGSPRMCEYANIKPTLPKSELFDSAPQGPEQTHLLEANAILV